MAQKTKQSKAPEKKVDRRTARNRTVARVLAFVLVGTILLMSGFYLVTLIASAF